MLWCALFSYFFFQAEDGIRDLVRSRGLGDVYKRQTYIIRVVRGGLFTTDTAECPQVTVTTTNGVDATGSSRINVTDSGVAITCLLYTSDAADDLLCVDLGGRRIIKKKKEEKHLIEKYDMKLHKETRVQV